MCLDSALDEDHLCVFLWYNDCYLQGHKQNIPKYSQNFRKKIYYINTNI